MKKNLALFAFIFLFLSNFMLLAQPSFSDYKKAYKPHNELLSPDNKAVVVVGYMDADKVAPIMEEYVDDKNKDMFALLISSIERKKAGKVIDNMNPKKASEGLNFMKARWYKDILWYVSESTYNKIASNLPAVASMGGGSSSGKTTSSGSGGSALANFKEAYKPHNELLSPDNKAVKVVGYMDADKVAPIMEEYVNDGNKEMFTLLICSIEREKAGKVIDNMDADKASKGLNFMKDRWYKDIVWYVSESTFNKISGDLPAIASMNLGGGETKKKGKFFDKVKSTGKKGTDKVKNLFSKKDKKESNDGAYQKFKESYKPHNELLSPDNKAVAVVGYMDADKVAPIMEEYVKDSNKDMFTLLICSIEREKAGKVIDNMDSKMALQGLKFMKERWSKDILWYVSEKTFNKIAGEL